MKYFIVIAVLLCFNLSLFSQDSLSVKKKLTRLEQISQEQGSIIKKEFYKFESIKSLDIYLLTIQNLFSGVIVKGLKFEYSNVGLYSTSTTYSSFLDSDEIEGLIKFLEFETNLKEEVKVYTEYNYSSKSYFKAFCYKDIMGKKDWTYGITVDLFRSGSNVYLKQKDIDLLLQYANIALEMIKK